MKRKIAPTLFELGLGIILYGIIFEIVLLFFSREPSYSLGLWVGVVLAVAGSVHMWWSLDRGLDMAEKDAVKTMGINNIIRYLVLVVVMAALIYKYFYNNIFCILWLYGHEIIGLF